MDNDGITTASFPELVANIRRNVARGLPQCRPHAPHDKPCVLLAGGPSLNGHLDEIREKSGSMPVLCTNGTYNWCLAHGITPKALIVLDARRSNTKFVSTVLPNCKYLFASQAHPELFAAVPSTQTWIWHSNGSRAMNAVIDAAYGKEVWHPVFGGCTVTLRGISLLKMLGWRNLHIYGFDGCLVSGEHHAYNQEENDGDDVALVEVNGRQFECHPWMVRQYEDYLASSDLFKGMSLSVYGQGLIASCVREV
jgi:hypothetical protein